MQRSISRPRVALVLVAAVAALAVLFLRQPPARTADAAAPDKEAVERARTTVKMLDDLHKGYVVTITGTYVKAQESTPAARVTKKVFKHMEEQGWGTGRLVDASGRPFNEANLPRTEFEKAAVAKLKAGQAYYDEVGTRDGKPVLRAATVVPAVMKECVHCHTGAKEGDLLGALVYEVPVR
jgi:hypothetical protein